MSYLGLVLNTGLGSQAEVAGSEPVASSITPEPDKNKRGKAWLAWEDRALAKQVLADDPIFNKTGKKDERWREVAEHLEKSVGMTRSGASCRNRMDLLVELHRKEETRSKQKTGEVEEVNGHVRNMTDICLLFDSVSSHLEIRQKAKDKLADRKAKASQLREASKHSQIRKRDLMEVDDSVSNGEESSRKKVRAPKNQFATEVEEVLNGLQEKADAFREAILERERRDKEREAREKQQAEEQRELNANLNAFISTMNAFIQNSAGKESSTSSRLGTQNH